MMGRTRIAVLLAFAGTFSGAAAHAQTPPLTAREVPGLVAGARAGDVRAADRLATWLTAARGGDAGALAVAADVVNAGVVAQADLVTEAKRQAAAAGYDARTALVDSIISGETEVSIAQATALVARTNGLPSAVAGAMLTAPFEADLSQFVVAASFSAPEIDPDDLVVDEIAANDETNIASTNPSKTVCRYVDYYEPVLNFTVMGLEVCATWKYDGVRYVGSGSRTINPYITVFGTARGWRWRGTNVAIAHYYNYKRKGAKSGYHTRTVGHFQRCPTQEQAVPVCDLEKLPQIQIDGHYNGTSSSKATP